MAQYTVTAGCGHQSKVQLFGAMRERERRLSWMRSASGKCNACYAALKQAEEALARELEISRGVDQMLIAYRGRDAEARITAVIGLKEQLSAGFGTATQRAIAKRVLARIDQGNLDPLSEG